MRFYNVVGYSEDEVEFEYGDFNCCEVVCDFSDYRVWLLEVLYGCVVGFGSVVVFYWLEGSEGVGFVGGDEVDFSECGDCWW